MIRRLDPRTKLLALVCVCISSLLASDPWRLAVLLGLATGWAAASEAICGRRRGRGLIGTAAIGAAALLAGLLGGGQFEAFATPILRMCIVLLAGRAFSQSVPVGELASALEKMRCPKAIVLIMIAAQSMLAALVWEVRLAHEAARIRAACVARRRSARALAVAAWRTSVCFCSRLLSRADQMAAAAELRCFSRPGRRSSLHPVRFRLVDLPVTVVVGVVSAALVLA